MEEKGTFPKLILHFFHERGYAPRDLKEFEKEAALAAQAGASHM